MQMNAMDNDSLMSGWGKRAMSTAYYWFSRLWTLQALSFIAEVYGIVTVLTVHCPPQRVGPTPASWASPRQSMHYAKLARPFASHSF